MKTELIPVIHMLDEQQVYKNIELCQKCSIEKVFLINHRVATFDLLTCAMNAKILYEEMWIGINMLGIETVTAISKEYPLINGLWSDETITLEDYTKREFTGLYFGGLAFKYQPQPTDLELACKNAILTTDVACTSGSGTGKAPTMAKINAIREYLGDHPMAIASGVSIDNIESYKGIADYLLVASSITDKNEMIIKDKLLELQSYL
jgi:hypothetical protein